MNKTIKILFAAALTSALFSCKKDEGAAVKTESEYWLDSGKLSVIINSDTLKNNNAYAVLTETGNDAVLTLKKVLSGYNSFEFKGKKEGKDITVDTTELWQGGRKVAIKGELTDGILKLEIADSSTLTGKWMIAAVEDNSKEVRSQGFGGVEMPAISIRSNIHELYIPYGAQMLSEMLGKLGTVPGLPTDEYSCRIDVDSLAAYFQGYARVCWADYHTYFDEKNSTVKEENANHIALLDYIEFTREGKMGICIDDQHAKDYFDKCDQSGVYKWVDSLARYYCFSGSSLKDLLNAHDPHCILNYTEYQSSWNGKPCFALSTGVIGGTIIDLLNTVFNTVFYSPVRIDAETFTIPVEIMYSDAENLTIGISTNTLFASFSKLAEEINKYTWEDLNRDFPGMNYLINWVLNAKIIDGEASIAEALNFDKFIQKDFQINEEIFTIIKPILASVVNVLGSLKDTEISVEIDLVPYEKELRPWEIYPR